MALKIRSTGDKEDTKLTKAWRQHSGIIQGNQVFVRLLLALGKRVWHLALQMRVWRLQIPGTEPSQLRHLLRRPAKPTQFAPDIGQHGIEREGLQKRLLCR